MTWKPPLRGSLAARLAAAACVEARTLEVWPPERLEMLWDLYSQGRYPREVAAALTQAFPHLAPLTNDEISTFAGQRKIRRGDPVPDPVERPDCYLYRTMPDVPAPGLPADVWPMPSPAVLERWTAARLALMFWMVERRYAPFQIAAACGRMPGPAMTREHVSDFLRPRRRDVRYGRPVPSFDKCPGIWLGRRPTPDDLDLAVWLPSDPPAGLQAPADDEPDPPDMGPARVVETAPLPWVEILDWARRTKLHRSPGQSDPEYLRAINRARQLHGLPLFRPARGVGKWDANWTQWRDIEAGSRDYRKPTVQGVPG